MKTISGILLLFVVFVVSWMLEGFGEAICGSLVVALGILLAELTGISKSKTR